MPVDRTKRAIAYHAIDTERQYQEERWGHQGRKSVDEFACYIAGYTAKLVEACATTDDADARLAVMRKVAGLCVACFEQHGVPLRDGVKVSSTLSERIEALRKKFITAKAMGEQAVKVGSEEYEDLVAAGVLETWRSRVGLESFQTFEGLLLDRLD